MPSLFCSLNFLVKNRLLAEGDRKLNDKKEGEGELSSKPFLHLWIAKVHPLLILQ
jgi:hypothetical protein